MDRLLNVMAVLQPGADRGCAGFGAARAYSRGILGELAAGRRCCCWGCRGGARLQDWIAKRRWARTTRASALLMVSGAIFLVVSVPLLATDLRSEGFQHRADSALAILEYRLETI